MGLTRMLGILTTLRGLATAFEVLLAGTVSVAGCPVGDFDGDLDITMDSDQPVAYSR